MDEKDSQETRPARPWGALLPWLGVAMLLTAGALTAARAFMNVRGRAGQVAYDIRQAWLPCGLALLWGLMGLRRPGASRRAALCLIVAAAALAALVLAVDQFNLIVEYHRWIERGMPRPWQFGGSR